MIPYTRSLHYGTEIMTYAETAPSLLLLKVKVVQLTWNGP